MKGPVPREVPGGGHRDWGGSIWRTRDALKNKAGAGRTGANSWGLLSRVRLLVLKEDRDSGIFFFFLFLTPLKDNDLEDPASPGSG